MASFILVNCTATHLSPKVDYSAQQAAQTLYIETTFDQSFDPIAGETPRGSRYRPVSSYVFYSY